MLELLLCSLLTILPDYLYRRYWQGKRFGKEITLYSVWFELRWGITACLMLTVRLITVIFYNHPSTTNVTLFFRTVPILPETNRPRRRGLCRVQRPGQAKERRSSGSTARSRRPRSSPRGARSPRSMRQMVVARADVVEAEGQIQEARSAHQQAVDELETKQELYRRNPGTVAVREIERLQERVRGPAGRNYRRHRREAEAAEARISTLLPAEKASAEAALAQAQVELDKTVIRAGVDGRVEQFALRVGDIVNPLMRPAGVLIPEGAGRAASAGRLRADRGADHEGRHGRRGHLRLQALDDHPDGGDGGAGLHRRRPIPRRRAVDRPAAGDAARNAFWSSSSRSTRAGSTA